MARLAGVHMEATVSKWPVQLLVYAAGDGNATFSPLQEFIEVQIGDLRRVATNRHLSALLQIDNTNGPSERRVLDPSSRVPALPIGETNTGDPNELVDFVTWANDRCPSERLVLVLSGHGLAWQDQLTKAHMAARGLLELAGEPEPQGTRRHARRLFGGAWSHGRRTDTRALLMDANARNGSPDFLDNSELGKACGRISATRAEHAAGGIDVLVFDACLMSAWEILAEVADSASTVVGAFDEISAAGMNLAGAAQWITARGGVLTPRELARAFPESYTPGAPTDTCIAVDLAGPDFTGAVAAWRRFCDALVSAMAREDVRRHVHRRLLTALRLTRFHQQNLADVTEIQSIMHDCPGVTDAARADLDEAVELLDRSVIARRAGAEYREALGVSLYVPASAGELRFSRPDYLRLRFASQTNWIAVLDRAFGAP